MVGMIKQNPNNTNVAEQKIIMKITFSKMNDLSDEKDQTVKKLLRNVSVIAQIIRSSRQRCLQNRFS